MSNKSEKTLVLDPAGSPKRSLIFRWLRNVRKSLENDGIIGQFTESAFYATLYNLRLIWLVLEPTLWVIEHIFGKYTMSKWDRLMITLGEPGVYGVIGKILMFPAVRHIDLVLGAWFAFDAVLSIIHTVLSRYTLEDHEIAQKEYKEALRKLGAVDEEEDRAVDGYFASFVSSKPFNYIRLLILPFFITTLIWDISIEVYDEFGSNLSRSMDQPKPDYTKFNPYRDIPPNQHAVIREVLYISYVLKDLTPTTLPGDDYQLFSDMLRSLETRNDMAWRVLEDTDIHSTIKAAAKRSRKGPIASEPFDITKRVKILNNHWNKLVKSPEKPQRWEIESDTTFLKPLLLPQPLGESMQKPIGNHEADAVYGEYSSSNSDTKLILSPEHDAAATVMYESWYRDYYHKVSYLKDHPPKPLGWVPVDKTDAGARKAWDMALEGQPVKAGQSVSESKLMEKNMWRPIFGSLATEMVPFSWVAPGEVKKTSEDYQRDTAAMFEESDRRAARTSKQLDYQSELKAEQDKEKSKVDSVKASRKRGFE